MALPTGGTRFNRVANWGGTLGYAGGVGAIAEFLGSPAVRPCCRFLRQDQVTFNGTEQRISLDFTFLHS